MGQRPFQVLASECDRRDLWLEIHVGDELRGPEGKEWRDLDRIDVTTRDGRHIVASALISSDVEVAAVRCLEDLRREAA